MSMYAVVDPATGETVKEYPTITDDELRDAIARADRAHREWSHASTVAERASLVRRVGELHSERRKELAEIIVAEAMAQMVADAGFPDGAYVNIYATNEQIEWVIADPRVRGVSVTGSERAGAAVAEIAGRNLKKVVLEMGGSDPFIVLGTDDLDKTVQEAVDARIDNAGQSCNAAKRFIVIDKLYEPILETFTAALTAVKQ